ncbi:hypothetical protein K443DRAFT_112306 [Laccaria amethystina LaAM-08-1]|uniref:Uncharacterized protein n=1 Tax=Laccaria amethystina LaAM-08-1 TaxID=1095629 RepID=A0A0C9WWQ0_9AGAR|nr:hypothetical protein K443DRAFT_112306 [Laccaria amethystina LaAM-08-1]
MRKAFHKGGNSSCRFHIRQHYKVYNEKCKSADIPVNHWAIPRPIWRVMEEEKDVATRGRMTKKQGQQLLDFKTAVGPREFTRSGILQAVATLIATNNQPLALADNPAFRNALVSMRPKSTTTDLPSSYDVKVYLHNKFVQRIVELEEEIKVSNSSIRLNGFEYIRT